MEVLKPLVVLFFHISEKNLYSLFFIEYPIQMTKYLMNEPLNLKQNKTVNIFIGNILILILTIQKHIFKDTTLLFFVNKEISFFHLKVCYRITNFTYKHMMKLFIDLLTIFRSKNYNRLKLRYDNVSYDEDVIIVSTLIFSVLIIFLYNLIGYFLFFLFCIFVVNRMLAFHSFFSKFT